MRELNVKKWNHINARRTYGWTPLSPNIIFKKITIWLNECLDDRNNRGEVNIFTTTSVKQYYFLFSIISERSVNGENKRFRNKIGIPKAKAFEIL